MLKNYIKLAWKVLQRKKLYTLITLLSICFPLIILTLVISFLSHITAHNSPQSKFDKVVCIDHFEIHISKHAGDNLTLGMQIPYKLYTNYWDKLKTPLLKSFTHMGYDNVKASGRKKDLKIKYVDANFWQITDFKIVEGRFFNTTDVTKAQRFALIDMRSKNFYFGNSPAMGQQIEIGDKKFTIIGVVESPDITKTSTYANIFIPLTVDEKLAGQDYFSGGGNVLTLLKNKAEKKTLEKEIKQIVYSFDKSQIADCKEISISTSDDSYVAIIAENIRQLFDLDFREGYIIPISISLIIFFFLLLPALNLIYINQSRFSERIEEIGLRKSFGSPSISIFRQFIAENTFITVIGGLIALAFSWIIIILFNKLQIIQDCYIELNWQVFALSAVIWLVLGFLSAALPSLKVSKSPIIESLQSGIAQKSIAGFKKVKRESLWLSLEIACIFIALFCISNFLIFFGLNLLTPLGFNHKVVYEIEIFNNKLSWFEQDEKANNKILSIIEQTSYVKDFTCLDGCNPYGGTSHFGEDIHSGNITIKNEEALYVNVSKDSWHFFGMKLIQGNWIDAKDTLSTICPVVINEKMKKKLFGEANPIGQKFKIEKYKSNGEKQIFEVKGVVTSFKHLGDFASEGYYVFYMDNNKYELSKSGSGSRTTSGYLKLKGKEQESSEKLLTYLKTKYPDYSFNINPLSKYRNEYLKKAIIPLALILFLCLSVFMIVLFGMFGVMWYKINLRIPEIGLRKSVGASNARIFRHITLDALKIAALGIIPGLILVIQLPLLNVFDFPVLVYALSIFVSIIIIILMVAIFTILPGIKAAKIQPAIALHDE